MSEKKDYGLKTYCPNETTFYRTHSAKGRLEISLALGEDFKKFKWLFQELVSDDGKTKQGSVIEFYCEPDELIGDFVHPVKSGRFGTMAMNDLKKALTGGSSYGVTLWSSNKGTEGKRGKYAEYREIKLQRSTQGDKDKVKTPYFLLSATVCDGYVEDKGNGRKLILPVKDENGRQQNATKIAFKLSWEQLTSIAYAIEREYNAYRTSQYVLADIKRLLVGADVSAATVKTTPAKKETVKKAPEAVTVDIDTGEVTDIDFDDLPF